MYLKNTQLWKGRIFKSGYLLNIVDAPTFEYEHDIYINVTEVDIESVLKLYILVAGL